MRLRRAGFVALVAAVAVLHALLLPALWPARLDGGAARDGQPARLSVQFTQVLRAAMPHWLRLQPATAKVPVRDRRPVPHHPPAQ